MTGLEQFGPDGKQAEWQYTPEFRRSLIGALSTGPREGASFCKHPRVVDKLSHPIGSPIERGEMARKRNQRGQLWLERETWYGRWREDVIEGGVRRRVRVQQEL